MNRLLRVCGTRRVCRVPCCVGEMRRVLITSTGLSAALTAAVETPPHAISASKSGITLAPPRRAKFAEIDR